MHTPPAPSALPALVAMDGGSSNLRVALLNTSGTVLASRDSHAGLLAVQDGAFAAALAAHSAAQPLFIVPGLQTGLLPPA